MKIAQRAALTALILVLGDAYATAADYTGFWKQDCGEPYGLQIKPYEGRHTVTFCGPGGCGTPDAKAATSIEGDPHYEVLSPEKIKIRYADKYAPIYTKCTAETNPVLEYSAADRAEERRGLVTATGVHLGYLLVAVLAYVLFHRRTASLPSVRRRVLRSGIAALLFSPGVYFAWPFANPTFALLAFIFSVATMFQGTGALWYFGVQAIYSLGPVLVVWALLFIVGHVRSKLSPQGVTGHGA